MTSGSSIISESAWTYCFANAGDLRQRGKYEARCLPIVVSPLGAHCAIYGVLATVRFIRFSRRAAEAHPFDAILSNYCQLTRFPSD